MAHTRIRHLTERLKKAASFWPVVALLGPRQSGKSTLFREVFGMGKYLSFDDEEALLDAKSSPKSFLQKLPRPLIIDEAQKEPRIFDAIKFIVDKERRPGSYFLTGSSQFSSKIGIRESLTGRIGLHYLYPLTLAEVSKDSLQSERANPNHKLKPRFPVENLLKRFYSGGLPVPFFTREHSLVKDYFQSWIETSVLRDARRAFGKSYNPDIAFSILSQITAALKNGEYATLRHFKQPSRTVRSYLSAFEEIFLLYKLSPHEAAVGSECWTYFDTGILAYFCNGVVGDGLNISFARIATLNEIFAQCEYSGSRLRPVYYKTARGGPVDLVWNDTLVKVSDLPMSQVEYDLRPLSSAMKKLKFQKAVLLWGRDKSEVNKIDANSQIRLEPWTFYS